MPGVLVLVEQYEPEPVTLRATHLLVIRGNSRGQRHLTAEIQCALPTKCLRESLHQGQQSNTVVLSVEDIEQGLGRTALLPRPGPEGVHECVEVSVRATKIIRVDEVLRELAGERQNRLGDGGGVAVGIEITVPGADHAMRELPQFGLGQQGRRRLDRKQESVFGEQPARIGVIGAHLRLAAHDAFTQGQARIQCPHHVRSGQSGEPRSDA